MLTQRLMGMENVDVTKTKKRRNRKRKDKATAYDKNVVGKTTQKQTLFADDAEARRK